MLTYDTAPQAFDAKGNQLGRRLGGSFRTHDGKYVDSTGAFMVGELERLDLTMHQPLVAVSWSRDIDLREDVTIADEVSSFTNTTFGSTGGLGTGNGIGTGKSWVGKATDQISGVDVDLSKTTHNLRPWALELKYTILELESAAKLGRPIDQQKYAALQLKHQMDIDEQVYYGDTATGDKGMINASGVTVTNLNAGQSGSIQWTQKTPDEILTDVNNMLTTVWNASAWAVMPGRMLIPPTQFGYISTAKVSQAGNVSILKYIQENNIATTSGRGKLEIFPLKWLIGAGSAGTIGTESSTPYNDRAIIYTKEKDRIRFPMTLMQRTPLQYDSIYHKTTYFCRLGVVEVVYAETIGYFDGL